MTQEDTDKLLSHGIDYNDAMERFANNASFYARLAHKFAHDSHYENLKEKIETNDVQAAYHEAHALKGVAGNLSFVALHKAASNTTEALRANNLDAARALLPSLEHAWQQTVDALPYIPE